MRAKITRPDGTVIELEGTPEEIERVVSPPPVCSPPVPITVPIDWERVTPAPPVPLSWPATWTPLPMWPPPTIVCSGEA